MALMFVFFIKSIIAKQFEGSQIKRMCIFHVLTVRGLSGREGASVSCMGLLGNAEAPWLRTYIIICIPLHSIQFDCRTLKRRLGMSL